MKLSGVYEIVHARASGELKLFVGVEAVVRQQRNEVVVVLDVWPAIAVIGEHLDHRARMQQHVFELLGAHVAPVPLGIFTDGAERRNRANT